MRLTVTRDAPKTRGAWCGQSETGCCRYCVLSRKSPVGRAVEVSRQRRRPSDPSVAASGAVLQYRAFPQFGRHDRRDPEKGVTGMLSYRLPPRQHHFRGGNLSLQSVVAILLVTCTLPFEPFVLAARTTLSG